MEPFLRKKKDIVIIEEEAINKIRVGDVIVFFNNDMKMIENKTNIICHRVIWIKRGKETQLIEKGDSFYESSIVNQNNYLGKVRYIIRNNVQHDMNKITWRIFNISIAVLSYLSLFYFRFFIKIKHSHTTSVDLHQKGVLYYIEEQVLKFMKV